MRGHVERGRESSRGIIRGRRGGRSVPGGPTGKDPGRYEGRDTQTKEVNMQTRKTGRIRTAQREARERKHACDQSEMQAAEVEKARLLIHSILSPKASFLPPSLPSLSLSLPLSLSLSLSLCISFSVRQSASCPFLTLSSLHYSRSLHSFKPSIPM